MSGAEPPRECEGRAVTRIRSNGAREEIPPKLTTEQRRRLEEAEKLEREQNELRRARMRQDLGILERYKSETEVESARDRDLAALKLRIDNARKSLESIERDRKKLEQEREFYQRREMPLTLKNAIETNQARRKTQEKDIAVTEAATERTKATYDGLIKRFRELTQKK